MIVMDYVVIGKIINTHGIKGELKVNSYSDFDSIRYEKGSKVYVGDDYKEYEVLSFKKHNGFTLVLFKGYEDINLVEKLKDKLIYKAKSDIKPLKKGEYYFSELRDLDVYIDDQMVGKVLRVEEGMRNNNLRIQTLDKKEHLIPYLPQFVLNVDLDNKRIDIVNMEGLLWK